jgi:hypothetical protein
MGPHFLFPPLRPKARGLVQHGGPPDWLEESDPEAGCDFIREWTVHAACPYRTVCPFSLVCPVSAVQLRADGIFFQLLFYSKCSQPSVITYISVYKSKFFVEVLFHHIGSHAFPSISIL